MIRAALYARYSSDQQRPASIADQQRICRERASREGWQIVGSYEDAAISGASKSPLAIARDLNADAIPGPKDLAWRDTSIPGDVRRGTGILNNELYVGVRAWNHKHSVKDPSTGKEVMRLNPESEWLRNEVPDLRIVSDALWESAKRQHRVLAERYASAKEAAQSRSAQGLRRPAYLLSGLLECGTCGGTYTVVVGDRYGCVGHHRRKTCTNNRTIRREQLERRALTGIAYRLVSAEKIEAAVAAYASHINRQNRERRIQAEVDRRGVARVERAIAGIMAAIEDGLYPPSMKARMAELEYEKEEISARLGEAPADVPDLHLGVAEVYKRKVAALTETLDDPATRLDASSDIRSLVGKIVLHPGTKRGEVHATLHGSLMGILDFVNDNPQPCAGQVITKVSSGSRR